MQPTVTVIIPVYNRFSTILRAVNSVLAQTFEDFELIIVDDGSEDNTINAVQTINDSRIRIIKHESNQGAAAARNTGMKTTRGKYIAWLDSDDEWLPHKLMTQLEAFTHATSDQKACYSAFTIIEKDNRKNFIPEYTNYKKLFFKCELAAGSTLIFERTLLDEIGYMDEALRRSEDLDWLLRYCKTYRFLSVNDPLANIYYTPFCSPKIAESSTLAFVAKYSNELRQFGIYRNLVLARMWIELASFFAFEHNVFKITQYAFKAFFVFPFLPPHYWLWIIKNWFGIRISLILSDLKQKSKKWLNK